MKSSPELRHDLYWWVSVPYLVVLPALAVLSRNGWAFAHAFGVFILLGIPLACISAWWTVTILYRILVSHTVQADIPTVTMLCLASLTTLAWGSYAAYGW